MSICEVEMPFDSPYCQLKSFNDSLSLPNSCEAIFSIQIYDFFQRKHKHVITIYIIHPHWHVTGSWNHSSCKTVTYLFYIVNIMDANGLAMQWARALATWYLLCWTGSINHFNIGHVVWVYEVLFHEQIRMEDRITGNSDQNLQI